MLMMKHQQVWK